MRDWKRCSDWRRASGWLVRRKTWISVNVVRVLPVPVAMLPEVEEALQVVAGEEAGDEARISLADFAEPNFAAVGYEAEGEVGLFLDDLGARAAKLFIGDARDATAFLGLGHSENGVVAVLVAVFGDAVPQLGAIAVDGNLGVDLRAVTQNPPRFLRQRIDEDRPRVGVGEFEVGHAGRAHVERAGTGDEGNQRIRSESEMCFPCRRNVDAKREAAARGRGAENGSQNDCFGMGFC